MAYQIVAIQTTLSDLNVTYLQAFSMGFFVHLCSTEQSTRFHVVLSRLQ